MSNKISDKTRHIILLVALVAFVSFFSGYFTGKAHEKQFIVNELKTVVDGYIRSDNSNLYRDMLLKLSGL